MFLISKQEVTTENKSSKGESFLKGTFILTVAGFVVKVIGSLNWIFVSRILGGEGIGLYQMAFPIYFFAMTVSQAGVPVAISIITAERVALKDIYGAKRVFHISMALMLVTGLFFSFMTYFAADWLIEWQFGPKKMMICLKRFAAQSSMQKNIEKPLHQNLQQNNSIG